MVSRLAFGAGPVSGLLTGSDADLQRATVARAVEFGINWFDTASTYGEGRSESGLGELLRQMESDHELHVATKVRVRTESGPDLRTQVVESVQQSLNRLRLQRVTLLQVHNSVTQKRNDLPTSVTAEDILGPEGILAGMKDVQQAGLVRYFGLTGIGDPDALCAVMNSGEFVSIQAPFHLLNPSALLPAAGEQPDPDYGGFLRTAAHQRMAVFAIRVYAGGALLNAAPSAHTLKTPFFPLDLYQRDQQRARALAEQLGSSAAVRETALRFVLSQPQITSAIIGFGAPQHVDQACDTLTDEKPHKLFNSNLVG